MKKHEVRYLIIVIFLGTVLWSCREAKIDPDKYVISVVLQASRDTDQINLQWYSPLILYNRGLNYYNPNAVTADRYELFVSENDTTNFRFLDEITLDQNGYFYPENVSGKKYFFVIKNYAKGANPTFSNKIWIMGGINPEIDNVVNDLENNSIQFCDISPDNKTVIYSIYDDNRTQLISLDLATKEKLLITEEAELASYSSSGDLIAFVSRFGINTSPQPTNMGIVSLPELEIEQATSGNNVIQFPEWSQDDLSIFYLNVDQDYLNPWQLTQYQIEDGTTRILISTDELMINNRPISSRNSTDRIYITAYNNEESEGIYEYDLINEILIETEQTEWGEYTPALAPNGKYLAFLSDRSGREEIWIKNLESGTYDQITADFDGYPQGKIAWSNDNHDIYFRGYYSQGNGIFKIKFEP